MRKIILKKMNLLSIVIILSSLFTVFFSIPQKISAVGSSVPDITYDKDTYENITPTNGTAGGITAGNFDQLTGANQTPTLDVNYTTDSSDDPWQGGFLNLTWTNHVKLTTSFLDPLNTNIRNYGFAFAGIINLPKELLTSDVLKALDWSSAKLAISNANISLDSSSLMSAGNHALRFGLGNWDYDNSMGIYNNISNKNDIVMKLTLKIDVTKLTADGNKFDTSPGKILSKGKLTPALLRKEAFSVAFYDASNVVQDRNALVLPGGRFYPKLTNGIPSPIPATTATKDLPTWNSYISPWDNNGKYNNLADTAEYVDGVNKNLAGTTSNRTVTLDLLEGSFAQLPVTRFNRVVNFFTGKNETAGSTLTHAPLSTTGLNQGTKIIYRGSDLTGTLLSPVGLTVLEKYSLDATVTPTNLTPNTTNFGLLIPSKIFEVKADWKATSLRQGEIRYRLFNAASQLLVSGFTDQLFSEIKNPLGSSNTFPASTQMPALATGQYYFDYKLVDPALNSAYPASAYQWASSAGITKLPLITVADFPQISATAQVTNLQTNQTGTAITGYLGQTVRQTNTFTLDVLGNPLADTKVTVSLPANTEFVAGSLKINGNARTEIVTATGTSISVGAMTKVGQTHTVTFDYVVKNSPTNVITTIPAKHSGNLVVPTNIKVPLTDVLSPVNTITTPKDVLELISVPDKISFGVHEVPATNAQYTGVGPGQIKVYNSRSITTPWQISATLTKEFQTASGQKLVNALSYQIGNVSKNLVLNQTTPLYSNAGVDQGEITLNSSNADQFKMSLNPGAAVQVGVPYQAEITWELTAGPTQ